MKIYAPNAIAAGAVSARPDRPAIALVHDAPEVRLATFRIAPGQRIAPHATPSIVVLSVLSGSGLVLGADGERTVHAGDVVVYAPTELHGMRSEGDPFVLLAVVAPRPAVIPEISP